jgi:hypothetical protein
MQVRVRDVALCFLLVVGVMAVSISCIHQSYRAERQEYLQRDKPLMTVVTVTRTMKTIPTTATAVSGYGGNRG